MMWLIIKALLLGAAIGFLLALPSCAHHATPYTVESPIGEFVGDWLGDEGPKVLGVYNPTPDAVSVTVACPSSDALSDGWQRWITDVPPLSSVSVLMQPNARDAYTQVCHVEKWEKKNGSTALVS